MSIRSRIALLVAVCLFAGCGGAPTEPGDFEFGRFDVYIRDEAGQPIDGVRVRLDRPNGGIEDEGGLTGSFAIPGYYFFLRTSGEFLVVIIPPAGYQPAPGQQTSVRMTFTRNQLKTINFVLRRTP